MTTIAGYTTSAPMMAAYGGAIVLTPWEARAPQLRPVANASAACRGDSQMMRPNRRNSDGFALPRRTPFRCGRRTRRATEPTRCLLIGGPSLSAPLAITRAIPPASPVLADYPLGLVPHFAHPSSHVDPLRQVDRRAGPMTRAPIRPPFELVEDRIRNEAAPHCQDIAVTMPMLVAAEYPHRLHQMQVAPGAGHRNVEKTAFFLDLLTRADGHVRRDAAIDDVQQEDGVPLLTLRRVDRRQHQVILVEVRRDRLGTARFRRVQGQLAQEGGPRRKGTGDLFQLFEVARPRNDIVVQALEMRLIPPPNQSDLPRPSGSFLP